MKPSQTRSRGFSLPELMVAVTIGLVLTLTISTVISRQESIRRGVTSSNDITGNTAYAAYLLDRELRSAGSGISQVSQHNFGCPVAASLSNTQLLPSTAAFPAPFASVSQTFRLVPVVVFAGAGAGGSDVIAVAAGNSGLSEGGLPVVPQSAAAGQIQLRNTIGIKGGDLILLSETGVGCMLQQVASPFTGGATQVLNLGGTYAADTINGVAITGFSKGNAAFVSLLGNTTGNPPRFMLFGISSTGKLVSYDLLKLSGTGIQELVDGVVDMRVLYGIDTTTGGLTPQSQRQVTGWVAPTDTNYTAATLTNGTHASVIRLQGILALRVGLVLRSDLAEKSDVAPSSLTLFSDLDSSLQYTYTVPIGTTNQRYRVVEFTVPLRNIRYSR